jgi:choline dehydrogenase-like flavoprotein
VALRPNLAVFLNSTVLRIVWNAKKQGEKLLNASAVEYMQGGQIFTMPVGKEVIVSGGTIGSPKVLELSGIGNSA